MNPANLTPLPDPDPMLVAGDTPAVSTCGQDGATAPAKITRDGITIFKRYSNPGACYYTRMRADGKVQTLCLAETADESFKIAKATRREIHAGRWKILHDLRVKPRLPQHTIGDLLLAYDAAPVEASSSTKRQNKQALLQLCRCGAEKDEPTLLKTPHVQVITAALVERWFASITTATELLPDQNAQVSARRTANSRYKQAASVLNPRALACYRAKGMHLENLRDFAEAGAVYSFRRLPKVVYNPPPDELITTTLRDWEALQDRNVFLAIGLELAFGLRKGEITQAKWTWLNVRQGYPVLDGEAAVKNHTGMIQVRALDPWYTSLCRRAEREGWRSQEAPLIITGSPTECHTDVFRRVGVFLREHGWETQKTNHALRAYAGSQIAMRYGIYEAQIWLRHSSVQVTESHYSHFVKKFRPEQIESLAARWAALDAPVVLTVVPKENVI